MRLTRLGRRIYGSAVKHDTDAAGRRHYRLYDEPPRHHHEDGTDLAAVDAGYVSVSPLRLRLDDAPALRGARALARRGSRGMSGALRYRTILFDLDGTLIDSIELILASHRHATARGARREPARRRAAARASGRR